MSRLIDQPAPATCRTLVVSDEDVATIERNDLISMLLLQYLIRDFETRLLELKDANLVNGPVHASIGQEAVSVGVSVALRRSDMVGCTHRAHGHFLAKALLYYAPADYQPLRQPFTPAMQTVVNRTLAEIMGLREGWCGGRGGSMHLYDAASGNLGSNGIVGGGIPIATGAGWAQKLQNTGSIVVSVFGDGAINQGCFHEVANMATLWGIPVLYLVENNLYAVGTCTGESSCVKDLALRTLGYGFDSLIADGMDPIAMYIATRARVEAMRQQPAPFLIEAKTYRYRHHGGGMIGSAFGYRSKDEEGDWIAKDPTVTFPQRLLRLGLLTADDDARLRAAARASVEQAIADCTELQDGKRVIPAAKWPAPASAIEFVRAEEDAVRALTFKERGDFTSFKPMTYIQAIAAVTLRNMQRDEKLIVLGEDVANLRGGPYAATKGIKEVFPQRLINTPISETGFVGISGGLACAGVRPVVEIMFPDFALMASDQLFNQIGKLRHMYGGQVHFPVIVRTRIAAGLGYGGQHSMDPSAFFAQFAGWRIMAPSSAFECVGLFNTAMAFRDPVLLVEHGLLYNEPGDVPANAAGEPDLDYCIAYGKANVLRAGSDVTVLTCLMGVSQSLKAAEELAAKGISAEVIDLRTLDYQGMDFAAIGASVKKTGSVLIVEQGPRSLTLGARIADEIQERFFDHLDAPIRRIAALDVPLPVSRKLEEAVLPSHQQIRDAMERAGRHQ